jgi:hypothetical protein
MIHGQGKGIKASDIFGFYGCINCHDWYDGRSKFAPPSFTDTMDFLNKGEWFRAMWEKSLIIATEKGYL